MPSRGISTTTETGGMSSDTRLLAKNFAALLSLRGLELLVPLLTIPYLLRVVGLNKYGLIGFSFAFASYFGAVVQYGFSVTATRDISRARESRAALGRLFSIFLSCSAVLAAMVAPVVMAIVFGFSDLRSEWSLHLFTTAQVVVQAMFPVWLFQGTERMSHITYLNVLSKLMFIVGLLVLVRQPEDYVYVPILNFCCGTFVLGAALWVIARSFGIRYERPSRSDLLWGFSSGRHAFINQLAPNLYNNSATFLLGLLSGGYAVGVYTAAAKVIDAVGSLGYVLANTFLPFLSRSPGTHNVFQRIMLAAGAGASALIYILADPIGNLLHPVDGPAIGRILKLMSVSVFLICAILTYCGNSLMLIGQEKVAARVSLHTSAVFFLVALAVVPFFGLIGCVATVVGARATLAILFFYYHRKFAVHV